MIKVNLLKSFGTVATETVVTVEDSSSSNAGALKNLVVMVLGVAVLFTHEQINIPSLNSELKVINNEIAEATSFNQKMDSLKREIQKYEKDLKRLNTQTAFLQKVQKERLLSVDLINKIKLYIPEKVWLNTIQAVGTSVEIKGDAESNSDVNEFNNRLATAAFLKDVVIVSSTLKNMTRVSVQTFNIKANYIDGKQLLGDDAIEMGTDPNTPGGGK